MITKNNAPDEPVVTDAESSEIDSAAEYAAVFAKLGAEEDEVSAGERTEAEIPVEAEVEVEVVTAEDGTGEVQGLTALEQELAELEILAENAPPAEEEIEVTATVGELKGVIEALLFVADEPLPFSNLCKVLGDVEAGSVKAAIAELAEEYEARNGGLELREIGGGWRISTRPQHHEFIRKYLKSKPSARLSLPALETLAVIAYRQPVTVPEILEIRGVTSSSAIKTLLEKRLIVTKGRKETVGRPMTYGTSKEFLIQFGLKDLNELPSIEDFEELAV